MEKAKAEVLRYLGHHNQNIQPELDTMLEDSMLLVRNAATPRCVQMTFDVRLEEDGVALDRAGVLLQGAGISHHLAGCGKAVLFATTIGVAVDNLVRKWEKVDLTRSLVLDACATQLIEQFCDECEEQVRQEAKNSGHTTTSRFSPGYGDLPLAIQPSLLMVLDAGRKIGLTCTESLIMLPRKSVTAIIGLGNLLPERVSNCNKCTQNKSCSFRRGKDNCGY